MAREKLKANFLPESYVIDATKNEVVIIGKKMPPPSSRIVLNQKNIQVKSARITLINKHGEKEIKVSRINHLANFEEVRLHTNEKLFPGKYRILLRFSSKKKFLEGELLDRTLIPSVDSPEAWGMAQVKFKS